MKGSTDINARNCGAVQPTIEFWENRSSISIGESARVRWTSTAGVRAGGNITAGNGEWQNIASPGCGTHTYNIILQNDPGCEGQTVQESASATLTVTSPPPNPSVSVSPGWIHQGQSASVSWSLSTGRRTGGTVENTSVSPGQGSYSWDLQAAASCPPDRSASASGSLTVGPPPDDDDDDGGMDCFATGTKITLADGSTKNVEDLKVGDMVRSFDVKTGQFVNVAVTEASSKEGGDYVKINGGQGVTLDHRFYSNGNFIKAGDLKVGDELIDEKGNVIKITSVEHKPGPVWVHPIRVQDPPATFIAEGVVVHNQNAGSTRKDEGLVTGTRITMANGKKVAIEKVTPGELILSVDPKTGMLMRYKVLAAGKPQQASKYTVINGKLGMGGGHQVFKKKIGKQAPKPASQKK